MIRSIKRYHIYTILLFCILQMAGIDVNGQEPIARQRRNMERTEGRDSIIIVDPPQVNDSLIVRDSLTIVDRATSDSITYINEENMENLQNPLQVDAPYVVADSVFTPTIRENMWVPNSNTSTWLAVVFPGGGQIYNRKYWKLPIIYGGFVGCAYALTWNNKTFKDYSQAYFDIMDGDLKTNSYRDFISPSAWDSIEEGTDNRYSSFLKRGKDRFRRYRDMSIFAFIGVYLISIIDAYVDAELSDFDISPDLSLRFEPAVINDNRHRIGSALGVQCSFRF